MMNYNYVSDKKSEQVKELARMLDSEKSAEAKKVEALLKTTSDENLKSILQERLNELDKPAMTIEEAQEDIEGLGYTMQYILKLGLSKLGNQLAWQEKQAAKKE